MKEKIIHQSFIELFLTKHVEYVYFMFNKKLSRDWIDSANAIFFNLSSFRVIVNNINLHKFINYALKQTT